MADPEVTVEDPIKPGAEGEQEPKAEEPTTEEAPEPEGGAVTEQEGDEEPADALKAVLEDMSPEERRALYDEAYEALSPDEKDGLRPEAASDKANAEASMRERDVAMKELADSRQNRDATFKAATDTYLGTLSGDETYTDQGGKVPPVDKKAFTEQRDDAYLQGQITWDAQLRGALGLQVLSVLEESGFKVPKELGNAIGDNSLEWFKGTIGEALADAKASAPDAIKAKAKADAEQEAGVVANKAKLVEALGGRRKKKALAAGGATGASWSTKTEARTLHVQDKLTNAEMRRINADPSIPEM